MKKILLITLLSLATIAKAQTTKPIEGFLGIKFGSTQAQVITAMKAKGAVILGKPTKGKLYYNKVALGQRKPDQLSIEFVNDKAYNAQFFFTPSVEAKVVEEYNALVKDLTNVYGNGIVKKEFKGLYEDGDGYEITAIKTGNANYVTLWKDREGYIGAAIEMIDGEMYITLVYTSIKLSEIADQKEAERNKSDL